MLIFHFPKTCNFMSNAVQDCIEILKFCKHLCPCSKVISCPHKGPLSIPCKPSIVLVNEEGYCQLDHTHTHCPPLTSKSVSVTPLDVETYSVSSPNLARTRCLYLLSPERSLRNFLCILRNICKRTRDESRHVSGPRISIIKQNKFQGRHLFFLTAEENQLTEHFGEASSIRMISHGGSWTLLLSREHFLHQQTSLPSNICLHFLFLDKRNNICE